MKIHNWTIPVSYLGVNREKKEGASKHDQDSQQKSGQNAGQNSGQNPDQSDLGDFAQSLDKALADAAAAEDRKVEKISADVNAAVIAFRGDVRHKRAGSMP